MRRRHSAGGLAVAIALSAGLVTGCGGPGPPKLGGPPHHLEHGFRNLNPAFERPPFWPRLWWVTGHMLRTTFRPRVATLPRVANDGQALRATPPTEATLTWVGHATFLIQLDGVNVLTDPHWSDRASPLSWGGPARLTPPGLRFEDLPPVHLVLISHDHYDHLDVASVTRLWAVHRPRFLVPLGLRAWLADLGITDVEELDWWESREVRGLTVTCTPVQHWSARSWWDQNRRLWSGWSVRAGARGLFFAGDSGYYAPIFSDIARRLGPFDLALVAIGAYLPEFMMRLTHTTPEQALRIADDVRAERLVAMHWGTFDLTDELPAEPPQRLQAEMARLGRPTDRVWILRHGETRRW